MKAMMLHLRKKMDVSFSVHIEPFYVTIYATTLPSFNDLFVSCFLGVFNY